MYPWDTSSGLQAGGSPPAPTTWNTHTHIHICQCKCSMQQKGKRKMSTFPPAVRPDRPVCPGPPSHLPPARPSSPPLRLPSRPPHRRPTTAPEQTHALTRHSCGLCNLLPAAHLLRRHPQALQSGAEHAGLRDAVTRAAGLEHQAEMCAQLREEARRAFGVPAVVNPVIGQHSCQIP